MAHLKNTLLEIKKNEYGISPEINLEELLLEMLKEIGNVDATLRDDLIYSTFNQWIVGQKLSVKWVQQILVTALDDDHLFCGLGEPQSDQVFTRTFSVLLIPLIFEYDSVTPFLNDFEFERIFNRVSEYCEREQDLRGYVEPTGWAHSVAHTADALKSIVKSSYSLTNHHLKILGLIERKFHNTSQILIHNEDDRTADVILEIAKRGLLSPAFLTEWIENFSQVPYMNHYPEDCNTHMNTRNLLRSIYFKMMTQDADVFTEMTHKILSLMTRF